MQDNIWAKFSSNINSPNLYEMFFLAIFFLHFLTMSYHCITGGAGIMQEVHTCQLRHNY